MNAIRLVSAMVFMTFVAAPSKSQILGPADTNGVRLFVSLDWSNALNAARGVNGIQAQIILQQDHIIVSKYGQKPEADNVGKTCNKQLERGANGRVLLSQENLQNIEGCDVREIRENASPTNYALFLPVVAGSRLCRDIRLSTGPFRICAALLRLSSDQLSMEYEEASSYDRDFRVSRVRFDIMLQRSQKVPLGHIWGCAIKVSAAFSFNPQQPSTLVPYQNVGNERCEIDATTYNGVPGDQPPSHSPEDQAILAAAQRKTTVCMPKVGGGYVASVYDREMTGAGDAIVETASLDDKGQLRFMNSKVYPGEIAWTSVSARLARSEVEDGFKAGKFAKNSTDLWGRTYQNGTQAFFATCHF
jgi:hypothetical protein